MNLRPAIVLLAIVFAVFAVGAGIARAEPTEQSEIVWLENSAHMIMMEEPGRVLVHLVQDVLPLAATAARAETAR